MIPDSGNRTYLHLFFGLAVAAGLYATSLYSFLLFHSLIELFFVFVAFAIFALAWNTRDIQDNHYFLFIGMASLFCGALDLMHTLAYAFEGNNGFPGYEGDLDAQLWTAFRYVSSASFLCAPFFIDRKLNIQRVGSAFASVTVLLLALIFSKHFPSAFDAGRGATTFKVVSEYLVSVAYLVAIGLLYRKRNAFDKGVLRLVLFSLLSAALTGLSYSTYGNDNGLANVTGHYFELLSNWLLYRAVIVTGLAKPMRILFRNLKQSEEELKRSEQKYRGLYDSTRDGIGMVDMQGNFIECNRSFADMLGYSLEEMRGLAYKQVTPPAWLDMEKEIVKRQILTRGYSDEYEKEYRKKDGSLLSVSVKMWLQRDESGRPAGMWGIVRDITERKRSVEHTLQYLEHLEFLSGSSAHFLRQMSLDECFDYAGDRLHAVAGNALVIMGEYDALQKHLTVRSLHCGTDDRAIMGSILGWDPVGLTFAFAAETKDRLVQGRFTKFDGGIEDLTFGQVPQSLCRQLEREMDIGEIHIMPFALEEELFGVAALLIRSGETLPNRHIIESFGNLAAMALKRAKDEDALKLMHGELETRVRERTSQLAETLSSLEIEFAERMRAEQTLVEQSKILEAFFQDSMTCLAILDTQFNFVRVNTAYALKAGRDASEFFGRNHFEMYPSEELKAQFQLVVETKEPFSVCARPFTYPDHPEWGETYWDVLVAPLLDNAGNAEFLVMSLNDVTERERAERALANHQEHLEELVRERTAQLEAANRELESFAFTVSHDLRAPLRSIAGFSRVIEEDLADRLDETGKDSLNRILAATARMGQLIDALLDLSRLSRAELGRTAVDLSGLARAVADDLRKSQPDRKAEFVISDGMTAQGDPVMLRAALENLISNAWKFTMQREQARIEFGIADCGTDQARSAERGMRSEIFSEQTKRDNIVYYVRDNGAGFDMTYASKLFTPFQRLHTTDEFPGLGIGLATVGRIIRRHGGRIWAEGAPGRGATFYFTLQEPAKGQAHS